MNYSNKETLYDEAKQSLKKFKGYIAEESANSSTSIKFKPAFLAEHVEALFSLLVLCMTTINMNKHAVLHID